MDNYSYNTSLPAYHDNAINKRRQAEEILRFINKGANNLLQLSELTGLPQSTIVGRVNDLKGDSKVEYTGFTIYKDRKRKKIVPAKKEIKSTQKELFHG